MGGPPQTLRDALLFLEPEPGTAMVSSSSLIVRECLSGGYLLAATGRSRPSRSSINPGELTHLHPHFLPDGKRFLYLAQSTSPDQPSGIYVKTLDRDDARLVVQANSTVVYVSPGYLVYGRDGTLIAQPFDASRAETTGDPVPFAERLQMNVRNGRAAFAVSEAGVLAYRMGVTATSRLVWRDRSGKELNTIGPPGAYRNPRLSPDGSRLVVEIGESAINRDLWLADAAGGRAFRQFTFGRMRLISPVWAPDGNHIAWGAGLWGAQQISGSLRVERARRSCCSRSAAIGWLTIGCQMPSSITMEVLRAVRSDFGCYPRAGAGMQPVLRGEPFLSATHAFRRMATG